MLGNWGKILCAHNKWQAGTFWRARLVRPGDSALPVGAERFTYRNCVIFLKWRYDFCQSFLSLLAYIATYAIDTGSTDIFSSSPTFTPHPSTYYVFRARCTLRGSIAPLPPGSWWPSRAGWLEGCVVGASCSGRLTPIAIKRENWYPNSRMWLRTPFCKFQLNQYSGYGDTAAGILSTLDKTELFDMFTPNPIAQAYLPSPCILRFHLIWGLS